MAHRIITEDTTNRDVRAIGSQKFPWAFPLWFSDIEPRVIKET